MTAMPAPQTTNPIPTKNKPTAKRQVTRIATWAITLLILGFIGFWTWGKLHPAPDQKLITAKIARGDLIETVSATGSVTAQTGAEVHIGSQISGTIKRLATDVGRQVKSGQLIAELDLPDLNAQMAQAQAALAQAETRYAQQLSGVHQVVTQTGSSLEIAQQSVKSAAEKLRVAQANASQQAIQTPSDIKKAATLLSTAKSVLVQTQAGANLQVATATEAVVLAQANATNSAANLIRVHTLYLQGFTSAADYDAAKAQDGVFQAQVRSASHSLDLVKQKVTADLQASSDAVLSATAALESAKAESQTIVARNADVRDAMATLNQAQATLAAAQANGVNDVLKSQDVNAAKEAVVQAKALVAFDQAQINKGSIHSPISGTVLQLAAQQGETVSAGLATQTLLIVADLNRLEIDCYVDETDIGKVKLGQIADCTVDAFPGKSFRGKVTKIASGSTIQQAVVTYDVTISIENKQQNLKPDMTASVSIQTGRLPNVVLIPAVALQIGAKGSSVNLLKVVDGKQTIVSTPIVTGGTDGVNIEVKSGLKEDDTIVLAGAPATKTRPTTSSSPLTPSRGGGPRGP